MAQESNRFQAGDLVKRTLINAVLGYQVGQTPDGRAWVDVGGVGASAGDQFAEYCSGSCHLAKAVGFVALAGLPAYWDASANAVTYKDAGDADFLIGVFTDDALSAADTCDVALNVRPAPKIDLLRDSADTLPIGTQALGSSGVLGFLPPQRVGGKWVLNLSATNEVQKVDLLSQCGFKASGAAGIVRIVFNVPNDGASGVQDFTLGIASGTHATDADSIAQFLGFHLDGNVTTINAESRDGTTTVARVSTVTTYTESGAIANRVELWIDLRNPADVQLYVNGSNVLPATVFNVAAAASEWKLLAHLEKTATADVYTAELHAFEVYTADERDPLAF